MAKDIRHLFNEDKKWSQDKMPEGHEARFLNKLNNSVPQKRKPSFSWMQIAASIVIVLGLSFGAVNYFTKKQPLKVVETNTNTEKETPTKSLGDISPDLKKIEDYYVANINLELSKIQLTPENKELFDGYLLRMEELNKEYKKLSLELTKNGPDEMTINALIANLKLRLNLMYRLKEQLATLQEITVNKG